MATYDIYNESGETEYTVKSQLSWGHCLKIFDKNGRKKIRREISWDII